MKAVILAAGLGSRMRPLSDVTHKTLLEVGGRTIIDRIVTGLRESGIVRMVVVTGYRADQLEDYLLSTFRDIDFVFVRNDRYATTNNVTSLALAMDSVPIDEDILLLESDLIYESSVLQRIIDSEHENVALVDRYRLGLDGTVVTLSADGVVTQVIPPSLQGVDFSFADKYKTLNIYKFSQEFCRHIFRGLLKYYASTIDEECYYELILGVLIYLRQVRVHAEVLSGEVWAEVDDPNDLRNAEFVFTPARRLELLEGAYGGHWNTPVIDFAFIRNMHFPPPSMLSQLAEMVPALVQNYGSAQVLLDAKMANFLRCDRRRVRFLNGASQFFPTLRSWFAPERVLLPEPTFGEYTRIFPGSLTYQDAGLFDSGAVLSKVDDADLLVVVNPNNPTGTTASLDELKKLVVSVGDRAVLVDESFLDFSDTGSLVPWLEDEGHENVMVLKSLSKVLGAPGVRLGFLYSRNEQWLDTLSDDLPIWNINSIAEHFIELVLKYPRELAESFKATKRDRRQFAEELRRVGIVDDVVEGGGNFLLVRLAMGPVESRRMEEGLLVEHGLYVKNASAKLGVEGTHWRLAVRSVSENRTFCAAVEELSKRIRL